MKVIAKVLKNLTGHYFTIGEHICLDSIIKTAPVNKLGFRATAVLNSSKGWAVSIDEIEIIAVDGKDIVPPWRVNS